MTVTLSQIRFTAEEELEDHLSNENVINWCNLAQTEFLLRIIVPGNTTIDINTTDVSYTLNTNIREIRRLRLQSDLDNNINRPYNPVYTFYNGVFEVPSPFTSEDTLLIDYYAYLSSFDDISDTIDIADRFKPLYTSYVEMMYYRLPSTRSKIGEAMAQLMYEQQFGIHQSIKKQVADYYIIDKGVEKPRESGW
jgi:hypothetical protein